MQFLTARIRYQLNDFSFIVLQKTLGLIFFFIQSQYILVVTQFGNKKKGAIKALKFTESVGLQVRDMH